VTAISCVYSDDKIITRWQWIKKWARNKVKPYPANVENMVSF